MADAIRYELLPFQDKLLRSEKPMIFAGCGIGSGKTDILGAWVWRMVRRTPQDVKGVIAANSYMQLYDSTLDNVFQNWRRWGLEFKPTELPRTHAPLDLMVRNDLAGHWVKVRCRSLEKWHLLSGQENGWYAEDEAWGAPVEGFAMLEERNRDMRMPCGNRALIITNLDDPSSWIYDRFVEKHKPTKSGSGEHWSWTESERELVIYASTFANLANLPDDYIDKQRTSMTQAMFERRVLSKWVSLAGGRIYYAFDRMANITEDAEYDEHLPTLWTHDFNIGQDKPMSSALCQIKKDDGRPVLDVFDELILDSTDTNDAVDEFEAREWGESDASGRKLNVVIYGDASGKARDTRSKTTDYGILRARGYGQQKVPRANPPIRTRHNIVNARLKNANGETGLRVHPRCKSLIKGLETVRIRKGAQYIEEETREQHVTTALGYLCCVEFPVQPRTATRDFWF